MDNSNSEDEISCSNDDYEKLKIENLSLNKQIDYFKIDEERRKLIFIQLQKEKACFLRQIDELKRKLSKLNCSGSCNQLSVEEHVCNCSNELVTTCKNIPTLYFTDIITTVKEFINYWKMEKKPECHQNSVEDLCDSEQIRDDLIDKANTIDTLDTQLLCKIKEFCNSFDASDYVKNVVEQKIVAIFNAMNNQNARLIPQDLQSIQLVNEEKCPRNECEEQLKNELIILTQHYRCLEKDYNHMKFEVEKQQLIDKNYMQNEINKYKYEIEDLKHILAKRNEEYDALQRIKWVKNELIDEKDEIIRKLNAELADIKVMYKDCESSKANCECKYKEMNANISELKECLTKEKCINSDQCNTINELKGKILLFENMIQGMERKEVLNKQTFRDMKKAIINDHVTLQREFDILNDNKNELKVKLECIESSANENLRKSNEEKKLLNEEIENLNNVIKTLKDEIKKCACENNDLNTTSNVDKLKIKNLKNNKDFLEKEIIFKKQENDNIMDKIRKQNDKINILEKKIVEIDSENKKLIDDKKELMVYNNKLKEDRNNFRDCIETTKKHLNLTSGDLENYKNLLKEAIEKICVKDTKIKYIECELIKKNDEWKRVESELQNCQIKLNKETRKKENFKNQFCISILERSPCNSENNLQYIKELDIQSLEIARLNSENKTLCEEKLKLQLIIDKAMCEKSSSHVGLQTNIIFSTEYSPQIVSTCCKSDSSIMNISSTCNNNDDCNCTDKETSTCSCPSEQCSCQKMIISEICICEKNSEIESLRNQLCEKNSEIESLRNQLENQLYEENSEIESLRNQFCEMQSLMMEKEETINQIKKTLEDNEQRYDNAMTKEMLNNEKTLNEIIAQLESRELEIEYLKNQVKKWQCKEEEKTNTIKELKEKIKKIDNELKKEQNEKNKHQKQTENLERSWSNELNENLNTLIDNDNDKIRSNENYGNDIIKTKTKTKIIRCKTKRVKAGGETKKTLNNDRPKLLIKCCINSDDPCPRRIKYNQQMKELEMNFLKQTKINSKELVENGDMMELNVKRVKAGGDMKKTKKK